MSPASKLKSKLKENSVRATKEQQKSPSKLSGPTNTENSNPGNAYNPVSGTFHSLDTAHDNNNPQLVNPDETDDHSGSSLGTAAEYDSLSNNGSCSGESEDHKEKAAASNSSRQEIIPGCDNEKREKIRQKNERKHQRQRERRAQELHERCRGYLMSRKLEELSENLVAMGFSSERATLALIYNEGRVEESVNWLLEGNEEEAQKKDAKNMNNLKLDISEELARISAMEVKFKCSKQEVERTVVALEGDLVKAEEALRALKYESAVSPTKPESLKPQDKPMVAASISTISDPGRSNFLSLKMNDPDSLVDKLSPKQVATSLPKIMGPLNVVGNEGRSGPHGVVVREPVMMMQRPQAMNIKQNYGSPPGTAEWYANNVIGTDNMKLKGVPLLQKSTPPGAGSYGSNHIYPQTHSNNRILVSADNSRQYYPQAQYTQKQPFSTSSWGPMGGGAPSPSLPVASSLGLFSGWGTTLNSGASSTHIDWNARDMMSICDYNSIDWTLEANSKSNGLTSQPGYHHPSVRVQGSNGGLQYAGLQNGGKSTEGVIAGAGGPREWTSPFAGNDIFSLPRQFVTSPSP